MTETSGALDDQSSRSRSAEASAAVQLPEAWTEAIKVDEFALLNWSWAGRIESRSAAVQAMRSGGIARLAPLAFDLQFDPDYYREVHPEYAELDDQATYRQWLLHDLERAWPPSPEAHLRQIGLRLSRFPEAFRWRDYIEARPEAGPNRWSALLHLLNGGFGEHGSPPLDASGAGEFLVALGFYFRGRDDPLAVQAFEQARLVGERGLDCLHELADAYYRLGRWTEALALFEEALRLPDAGLWTVLNGARSANRLQLYDRALEVLRAGKTKVAGDPLWRTVLRETIESRFADIEAEARSLYGSERRAEADALLTEAVDRTAHLWRIMDPLGPALPAAPARRVVLLVNTDLRQCTHYRVEQKAQMFEVLGRDYLIFDARTEVEAFISALPGAGAAIFYRLPAFPINVRAIEAARALGVPSFYEVDDLIFDSAAYPEPFETYGGGATPEFYHRLQLGVPLFRAAMALCDYGIASTTALAAHMKRLVRRGLVFVLPNGLDDRNEWMLESPPERVRRDDSVVLFYGSGTTAHNSDFLDLAGPGLIEAMRRRPNLKLMIVGFLTLDPSFEPFGDRIVFLDWVPDVAQYWSLLVEADINLAVLAPYPTTDAKSEIKWLEAAAVGVPSVVSGTARYREVLADGVDALIARTPQEWSAALDRMIDDPELRRSLVRGARDKAARCYSLRANARALQALLQAADGAPRPSPVEQGGRRRVLLVNIFFPPQSIGGSTRVVRDNLDAFLEKGGAEDLDFAVFASEDRNPIAHHLRVESYRGVPVFRVSTPEGPNMEWTPFFPEVGDIFGEVLRTWRPDLVHFHALARLSASVVEACADAGIPYVTTLHDAWWISDYHFLVDHQGRVRQPCEPIPLDPPPPVTVGEALERRRRLKRLLSGSEDILGVSRTFTEIYKRCGFEKTISVPNGAPKMIPAERTRSPTGRVRLGHVGSQSRHKGHHLVEAALKQSRFERLELTVVDHTRFGGAEELTTWGATPVRVVGKKPQERMHELYAELDVLLAPSIWPESFGLVSREALAAGLWVVASDVGAMGEDVVPGVNGWVIDVSTVGGLIAALSEMNADPENFLRSPPASPLRTAEGQAHDLLAIYRKVLRGRTPKDD